MTVPTHITSTLLIFLLLCSALLATTLQGVQGEVEVEGPSESECRPYIEKALKQLEIGDTPTERSEEALKSDEDTENKSEGSIEKTDVDELTSVEETLQDGTSQGTDSVEIENETEDEGTNEQNDTKEVDESGDTLSKEEITESTEAKSEEQEEKETSKEGEEQQSKEDTASSERPDEAEKSTEEGGSAEETVGSDEGKPTSTEDGSPSAEDTATGDAASSEVEVETDSKETDVIEETASAEEAAATEEADSKEQEDDTKEKTSIETTPSAEDTDAQSEEKTVETSAETADTEEVKDDEKSAENIESAEKEESAEGEAVATSAEETDASEATETEDSAADEAVDSAVSEEDKEAKESAETGDSGAADTTDSRGDETDDSAAAETKESTEDTAASAEAEANESDETGTTKSTEAEAAESVEETAQSAETEAGKSGESGEKEEAAASTEIEAGTSAEVETRASAEVEAEASAEVEAGASAEVEAEASAEVEAGPSAEVEAGASTEVEAGASAEAEASTEAEAEASTDAGESAEKAEDAEDAAESAEGKEASEETANVESEEAASEEKELVPEEELIEDIEIPTNLRSRDHINQILQLNEESTEVDNLLTKAADITLRELKRLYENAIKPLEVLYKYRDLSNRHFGDSEIFSKPLVLFMGPWSGGKSSIINYLLDNEYSHTSLRTGAEPSPAYFNILIWGEEPEVLDGTQMAPDFTFSGLQKFGQGLEERLRGHKLPSKLLEKINIVEIPGILEVRKQVSRVFPFNDACQWFIDRADIIFLVYDPSKLDVGPETEAILDQLKGREYQTRIILNKADQVKPEELMRVQGALIWNISPLMSSAQPPVMYTTSLWSRPYEPTAPVRLLQAQEKAFLRDLKSAIDKRIENKIASARRFAVRVRNHAKMVDCYLTTYYNHKSVFGNKKLISDQIIEHPQDYHIYEGLSTLTNISRYDLPDPDVYRDFFRLNALYDFQQLSATCTYFRGCPINRLDMAIAYDLPELVGKYKKMVESALSSVPDSEAKS